MTIRIPLADMVFSIVYKIHSGVSGRRFISDLADARDTVTDFDGANQTRLTNRPGEDIEPDWSPDGSKIVFVNSDNNLDGLCTVNANGSGLFRIVEDSPLIGFSYTPDWSPDGAKVIYFRSFQLYTVNATVGGETQISSNGSQNTYPSWQTVDVQLPRRPKVDFNADGETDIAIYCPTTGDWWISYSSTGRTVIYRLQGEIPVLGDYDGKADFAAYYFASDSNPTAFWSIYPSSSGMY
jgi:dipeptidyl aminopeptidase/acylaminoacyl peptidase